MGLVLIPPFGAINWPTMKLDSSLARKTTARPWYRNVGALEYDRIWSEVEAGRYEYEVIEEEFDVAGYVREFGRAAADAP